MALDDAAAAAIAAAAAAFAAAVAGRPTARTVLHWLLCTQSISC